LHVVSSIPPQLLKRFLYANSSEQSSIPRSQSSTGNPLSSVSTAPKRTVVLIYLFLNEEPHFPHAWLQVTCPSTRIGRITNYAAFSRDMVPEGKTCLCCEMYCFGPDKLLYIGTGDGGGGGDPFNNLLADKGYHGAVHALTPYKGKGNPSASPAQDRICGKRPRQ
jgi:hypothetical protein